MSSLQFYGQSVGTGHSRRLLVATAGFALSLALADCSTTRAPVAAARAPTMTPTTPTTPVSPGATSRTPLGAVEEQLRTALAAGSAVVENDGTVLRVRFPARSAFAMDQFTLQPNFVASLDTLVHVLRGQEQLAVTVSVSTDAIGSEAYNRQYSQQRAQAIASYLIEQGVAARRITTRGAGESPATSADYTPEGRDLQRRVELSISTLSS